MAREYNRSDQHGTPIFVSKIGIDARWGKITDVVKRFVQDHRSPIIVPVIGQGITPAQKQYEEYHQERGWQFENQTHPGLHEAGRGLAASRQGRLSIHSLVTDINRLKTFLMLRLSCPLGVPGAITLYDASPSHHEMFADQVAGSEYPEAITARGRTKDMFIVRDGGPDNEYLDCAAGCMALASWMGCRIRPSMNAEPHMAPRKKLSDIWREKKHGS